MRGSRRLFLVTLPIVASVLLACGDVDPEPIDEPPANDEPTDDDRDAAENGALTGDSREVTIAMADAADRTGLTTDDITLVELSMVTWPDGALGCPEPGMMYTQALVDGFRIVLDADGETLVYHGALGSDPFLCEDPQEPLETTG